MEATAASTVGLEAGGGSRSSAVPASGIGVPPAMLAMWLFLATVGMLFAAFASAYLVRRAGSDWRPVPLPAILWWNSGVLAASSVALEAARFAARRGRRSAARRMAWAAGLGLIFLLGQAWGWRELVRQGVMLPSTPHAAFVYILTGLHGIHLAAGVGLLAYAARRLPRGRPGLLPLCAAYWHFLGVLWILVFFGLRAG